MNLVNEIYKPIRNVLHSISKRVILSTIICGLAFSAQAQSPEAFNYQAVVRDGSGNVLANQSVGLEISIKQGSISGTNVYVETFSETSNAFGLVNIAIGTGTATTGVFADIDWSNGPYFIQTALDITGGTTYVTMGTSQLLSVPYALYASAPWVKTTNGIHYGPGNVGVGTGPTNVDPTVRFQIRADGGGSTTNLRLVNDDETGSTYMLYTTNGADFDNFAIGINNTASASGAREAFIFQYESNDIKFGTNSTERMRIMGDNGNIGIGTATANSKVQVAGGDVYIEDIGSGVIMKSPDGNCWRMTVSNAGAPVFASITCP